MAKSKPSEPSTIASEAPSVPDKSDHDLAAYALRCLYGCGVEESVARLAAYDDKTIAEIAEQERGGRRDRVPAIIAKAVLK